VLQKRCAFMVRAHMGPGMPRRTGPAGLFNRRLAANRLRGLGKTRPLPARGEG
jgi:hypothetical protein